MSWDGYAKLSQHAKGLQQCVIFGHDGTAWGKFGFGKDVTPWGPMIVQMGNHACKGDILGDCKQPSTEPGGKNMMWLRKEDTHDLYKSGDYGAAIYKTSKTIVFALVKGTPQDALVGAAAVVAGLKAVGY
eukprot:gb/GEZN01022880.1/.p1 GENE.gb/GEZN01022880.1/~~gb/GEZN01022880.1/.p1  ORF type:complete len:130 (+),score=14.69 gb/GEZN01022880.1/:59-448(+)